MTRHLTEILHQHDIAPGLVILYGISTPVGSLNLRGRHMLRPRQFLAVVFRPSPLLGRAPGFDLAPRPSSCPSDSVVLDPIVRLARQECGLVEAWGGEQALNLIETVQEMVKDLKDGGAIKLALCSPRTAQTIASATLQPHLGGSS